jgi:hypothetical protein
MTAITKTQMVNACADYEVEWFFDREPAEQREVFRHIMPICWQIINACSMSKHRRRKRWTVSKTR